MSNLRAPGDCLANDADVMQLRYYDIRHWGSDGAPKYSFERAARMIEGRNLVSFERYRLDEDGDFVLDIVTHYPAAQVAEIVERESEIVVGCLDGDNE